mmetsp:Transcript_12088/g.32934  ORF Transcript_12088/g.32934 Transcript_12088/m.32934 type:complete len:235 (+) Transcript_12088:733-1437(+)
MTSHSARTIRATDPATRDVSAVTTTPSSATGIIAGRPCWPDDVNTTVYEPWHWADIQKIPVVSPAMGDTETPASVHPFAASLKVKHNGSSEEFDGRTKVDARLQGPDSITGLSHPQACIWETCASCATSNGPGGIQKNGFAPSQSVCCTTMLWQRPLESSSSSSLTRPWPCASESVSSALIHVPVCKCGAKLASEGQRRNRMTTTALLSSSSWPSSVMRAAAAAPVSDAKDCSS